MLQYSGTAGDGIHSIGVACTVVHSQAAAINGSLDFLALNFYTAHFIKAPEPGTDAKQVRGAAHHHGQWEADPGLGLLASGTRSAAATMLCDVP